jgi:hypothetical protein
MNIEGFVIVPPLNTWDEPEKVIAAMSYMTFGLSKTEAWIKLTGKTTDDPDFSIFVQRWHDKGYRLKEASMSIKV